MSRWSSFVNLLLGQPAAQTTPTLAPQENAMARTTRRGTAAEQLDQIHAEIAALDAQAAADDIAQAADLHEWSSRDQRRRVLRLRLEADLREVNDFGELLDDRDLVETVREHNGRLAPLRGDLAKMRPPAHIDEPIQIPRNATGQLDQWARALGQLARRLPIDDLPAARDYIDRAWTAWFERRDMYLQLVLLKANADLPRPEGATGDVPGGGYYGYCRRPGAGS